MGVGKGLTWDPARVLGLEEVGLGAIRGFEKATAAGLLRLGVDMPGNGGWEDDSRHGADDFMTIVGVGKLLFDNSWTATCVSWCMVVNENGGHSTSACCLSAVAACDITTYSFQYCIMCVFLFKLAHAPVTYFIWCMSPFMLCFL